MNDELKQIKKIYGEEMMQLCRSLFPTILQEEGTLLSILKQVLAPTHSLAKDIIRLRREVAFEDWINSYVKKEEVKLTETDKTPFELMDEKGYILYECKSEKDIQAFKKYYQPDEKLCTFKGGRLNRCYVFFAVKKNVDEIQRKDFPNPMREDPYGTSVISIQFSKGNKNTLSIKNRYNHTITDPDSTFYNNLENIILGLTRSFEKYYGLKIEQEVKTSAANVFYNLSYVRGNDGRNYQYNLEVDGIFYCENNIIIKDGKVIDTYAMNKERYLLIDCFVVDLQGKKVFKPFSKKRDAFIDSINDVGKIKNIVVLRNGDNRDIIINYEDNKKVQINIDKQGNIIGYENNHVKKIKKDFLAENRKLKRLSLSKAKTISIGCLFKNQVLEELNVDDVEEIGNYFLARNLSLIKFHAPKVRKIGSFCLSKNTIIDVIDFPNVVEVGERVLCGVNNERRLFKKISMPNLRKIGDGCLIRIEYHDILSFPMLEDIGDDFGSGSSYVKGIYLPKVKRIGSNFFKKRYCADVLNYSIEEKMINLPEVVEIGDGFFYGTETIELLVAPKLQKVGDEFLPHAKKVVVNADNIREVGAWLLSDCPQEESRILKLAEKNQQNDEIHHHIH